MSSSIRLTVPAKDKIEHPKVETRPSALADWEKRLPYASPTEACEAVLHSLRLLNRYPRLVPDRLQLMLIYRRPYRTLLTAHRHHLKIHSSPSQARLRELPGLLNQLAVEMAYGFKLHINEVLDKAKSSHELKSLGTAIYFAVDTIMLELMFSFENYDYDSSIAWREIYQLYAIAQNRNIHNTVIQDTSAAYDTVPSINTVLKRASLLYLLDPYRLFQGDIWVAHDYLLIWASKADIEPLTATSRSSGRFLLDIYGIKRIRPYGPGSVQDSMDRYRLLNTLPLNQLVNRQLLDVLKDEDAVPNGLKSLNQIEAAQLLRRMLMSWHHRPERRSERYEKYEWLQATCGVSAAHHFLHLETFDSHASTDTDDMENAELSPVSNTTFERDSIEFEIFRWRQINGSTGGLAADVKIPYPPLLQVGQLILLENEKREIASQWIVAVVRRMIHRNENSIELGAQFVGGIIQPISLRPITAIGDSLADFQPTLLVTNERGDQTLISPCGMYRPGRVYLLEDRARITRVVATKLVESTPGFDRFFIEIQKTRYVTGDEAPRRD